MKPLDPRLLRHAAAVRSVFALGGLLGLVRTLATIAWCWALAHAITAFALPVLGGLGADAGRISEGAPATSDAPQFVALATAAFVTRAVATWGMDVVAARGAVRAKEQLRSWALDALDGEARSAGAQGPRSVRATTVLGRGLDALDGYFSNYLPQLILAVVATPVLVAAVLLADPVSGITVLIVFPVIPLFMILIGLATRTVQDRQWSLLRRLSGSFLDAVEGLSTLKIFRREHRQVDRITREADDYRVGTMKVLRVTFLSGFVLDLAGTFSIALVAVTIGTRLVDGAFPLTLGLFVLLLVPEAFIPIRQVGAAFHASTEGLAAAADVFELVEEANAQPRTGGAVATGASSLGASAGAGAGAAGAGSRRAAPLEFAGVTVRRGDRDVVGPVSFCANAGSVTAIAGPSGAGKSSLIAAAMGFAETTAGVVRLDGLVSWAGQQPELSRGTVAANVALGDVEPDLDTVRRALDNVRLGDIDASLELGALGSGISGGQAQRVALARALYRAWKRDASVLLLDEPTSALDTETEAVVCEAMRAEASAGRAVVVVSHRDAVLEAADTVVTVSPLNSGATPESSLLNDGSAS